MPSLISTRDLSNLSDVPVVERVGQSIAALDAILSPEWEYRLFSFNAAWDLANNERMASMRDGSGDAYFAVFSSAGAILKGFAHESLMSPWISGEKKVWAGVLDEVPRQFSTFLAEPAFSMADTTFCVWRAVEDLVWHCGHIDYPEGDDPDGSESLLWMFDANPVTYQEFAERYYERPVSLEIVRQIYDHVPLTEDLARKLDPDVGWDALRKDVIEIGYPFN